MKALLAAAVVSGAFACALEVPTADWQSGSEREPPLAIESNLEPVLARSGEALRIVTFNVEFGEDTSALASLFESPPFDEVDAFLLQEIEDHAGEDESRAARLAAQTGMAYVYLPAKSVDGGTLGVAILARRPLSNVRFIDLPFFRTSIRDDTRVGLAVQMAGIDIVNVHLFLQLGLAERIMQLAPATEDLAPVAVLGGDLNTNPYAWADMVPIVPLEPISDIDVPGIIDDAMREFGFDPATAEAGPTHHSPVSELRLDSIYTRGLMSENAVVERGVELSDHWPLRVDVAF